MRRAWLIVLLLLAGCGGSSARPDERPRQARLDALAAAAQAFVPGAVALRAGPYSSITLQGSLAGPHVAQADLVRIALDVAGALGEASLEAEATLLVEQARLHERAFAKAGMVRIATLGTGSGTFERSGSRLFPAQDAHGVRIQASPDGAPSSGLQGASYQLESNAPRWLTWSAYVSPDAGATAFVRMELDRKARLLFIEIGYSDRSTLGVKAPFTHPAWSERVTGVE